ncbi:TPA: hypothetical protein ACH3X2_005624 [Trebouxia sp. C0005]
MNEAWVSCVWFQKVSVRNEAIAGKIVCRELRSSNRAGLLRLAMQPTANDPLRHGGLSLADLSNKLLANMFSHVEANMNRSSHATVRQPVFPVTGSQLATLCVARTR